MGLRCGGRAGKPGVLVLKRLTAQGRHVLDATALEKDSL